MSALMHRPAVLVVEDESLVRMFAVDIIADEGYEVIEAANAEQALAKLEGRPDIGIVFTDITMPGAMDGIALAREINNRRPDIHVILTSGKHSPRQGNIPTRTPFVTKPYSALQLVRLLSKALE